MSFGVALLTVSDTAAKDSSADRSGPALREILQNALGGIFTIVETNIVPDEVTDISATVKKWAETDSVDWIITTGGTGFGRRDCTPEAITPLIERAAPGVVHLLLQSSLQVTPLAALSRPVAGTVGNTLVVTLPGSPKAVKENMSALLSAGVITHALDLIKGGSGKAVHQGLGLPDRTPGAAVTDKPLGHNHHDHSHTHHHHHHHHAAPVPKSHDPSLGASARHRSSPYPPLELNDALAIVQNKCTPLGVVKKSVNSSLTGHVLAEDVVASTDLPLSPTTNVDGYAIHSSLKAGTYRVLTPRTFSLTDGKPLPSGVIYRINTGSPLPLGTDAVVMVEDTELVSTEAVYSPSKIAKTEPIKDGEEEFEVKLLVGAEPGENVRAPGSDVRKGDLALEKGTLISALGGEVGTLAFVGQKQVTVFQKPVVALMSTGNEIVDLEGAAAQSGEAGRDGWSGTYDTNRPSLRAALEGLGYEVRDVGIVSDDLEAHVRKMQEALSIADVLITTGGSSMGSSDLLKPVIERRLGGTIHFGRVAVKPGKPTTFATVPFPTPESDGPAKPVFALPGNPASALVMFYVFVVPALRRLGGWDASASALPRVPVEIMHDMPLDPRPEFHRVHIRASPTGLKAYSTGGQRSSRAASLAGANGFIALPARPQDGGKTRLLKGETAIAVVIGEIQHELMS